MTLQAITEDELELRSYVRAMIEENTLADLIKDIKTQSFDGQVTKWNLKVDGRHLKGDLVVRFQPTDKQPAVSANVQRFESNDPAETGHHVKLKQSLGVLVGRISQAITQFRNQI